MSRRCVALCMICMLLLSIPGLAAAGKRSVTKQAVSGMVLVPTGPYRVGPVLVDGCSWDAVTNWAANIELTYRIGVDPGTYGRPFALEPGSPADLYVVFTVPSRGEQVGFDRAGVGAETGKVPRYAEEAVVCLAAGPPTTFTYRTR